MNNAAYGLNALCNAIGLHTRTLVADYRDSQFNYYSMTHSAIIPHGTNLKEVILGVMKSLEVKGYTVYSIYEILDGYTLEELEQLSERDIRKAKSHVQILYLDLQKE